MLSFFQWKNSKKNNSSLLVVAFHFFFIFYTWQQYISLNQKSWKYISKVCTERRRFRHLNLCDRFWSNYITYFNKIIVSVQLKSEIGKQRLSRISPRMFKKWWKKWEVLKLKISQEINVCSTLLLGLNNMSW